MQSPIDGCLTSVIWLTWQVTSLGKLMIKKNNKIIPGKEKSLSMSKLIATINCIWSLCFFTNNVNYFPDKSCQHGFSIKSVSRKKNWIISGSVFHSLR